MFKHKNSKKTHNFFFLLIPPLFLAFILLVIIPIITYSSDIYSSENKVFNLPKYLNGDLYDILDNLENVESESELIEKLNIDSTSKNIIILKNDEVIFNLIEIESAPTSTVKREIELANGENYCIYLSFPLLTKSSLFIGLIFRYILLIFCIVSFITINKVRKHLKKLEKDTEKIASGDYDTPIINDKKDSFNFLDDSLENMRIRIKEDRSQLSRFFAGVSHDLKTPLASIIGYTEALQDGMAKDKEAEATYLNIIHDKSSILVDRISSLISYIKIADQGFRTSLKTSKLYPFLLDFCENEKIELSLTNLRFEYDLQLNKEYTTSFDEILINRVLENLIQNAIKYGDNSKPIKLEASQNYEGVSISLTNSNKTPIAKEALEHIFEPFYRGDNSRKGKGFGLGLAAVQSIISSHRWKIMTDVKDEDNTIKFTILIPLY